MATGKIKTPGAASAGSSLNLTTGLPGITTSDATSEDLLAQTAQDVAQNLSDVNSGLNNLISCQQQQAEATQENTQALETSTAGRGGGGAAGTIESAASSLLGGGGLLSPILSGIMSLFGGSSSQNTTVFQPFSLPPPIAVQSTIEGSGTGETSAAPSGTASTTTAVTVQVNAIDSQSFIDHQDDIAEAVRQAILQSHPINDVISQL